MASPNQATPSSGSPAGTEYGIPFDQGRHAGGGGSNHGGGPAGSIGGGGSGGGTGSAGGGGSLDSLAPLFGAGIRRAAASHGTSSGGSASSRPSASGGGHHGASKAVHDVVMSARAVADKATAGAGTADGQVALIVALLLGTGAALAVALRFAVRRSPPPGAA